MSTPLQVVAKGAAAGYAGMAAMVVALPAAKAIRNEDSGRLPLWRNASPAARTARRVIEGVAKRDVSRRHASQLNYGMHALYAPLLGAGYAIVEASVDRHPLRDGTVFAASVWSLRLLILPGLKLGKPVWKHSPRWDAVDAALHLVFGLAAAAAYQRLDPPRSRPPAMQPL